MLDVVHQNEDDFWYFWDECWAFEYGPYSTKEKAKEVLMEYYEKYLD